MSLKEYIQKVGKKTFSEEPFNEVDNLLFSLLVYIDFRGIMPDVRNEKISLEDAAFYFFSMYGPREIKKLTTALFIQRVISCFRLMSKLPRYRDILLSNYVYETEKDTQFGAISLFLDDGTVYIAFEGTDDTVSGWKEDFQLVYQYPVLAQKKAAKYLNKNISLFGPKVRVGGHSKGGNLAMAGYMLSSIWTQNRIVEIYNNDGPGFRQNEFESKKYSRMLKKLKMFIPEESFVGLLFYHPVEYFVVKSSNRNILQHDATSWFVQDTKFEKGKLSALSKKVEKRIFNWVSSYEDCDREKIVVSLFSVLEDAGVKGLSEIKITKLHKIIAAIKDSEHLDKETRKLVLNAFTSLLLQKEQEKLKTTSS